MKQKPPYKVTPGDMLLFKGHGFGKWVIREYTQSDYDHIGIIVEYQGKTCVLESVSTPSKNIFDVITKKPKAGVRLVPLKSILKYEDETIFIRPLFPQLSKRRNQKLIDFYTKNRHRKFETSYMEMFRSSSHLFLCGNKENFHTVFCSELIARALKVAGFGKHGLKDASNNYSPAELSVIDLKDKKYRYSNSIYQIKPSPFCV